jgi:glycosyltransferase involved in cell wall biosynthesis
MQPLVSILIPAYNAEEWIGETIHSAIGQTWPRKEIIVVDDGSRDRTLEVARQFASKELPVVSKENQGAAATRNHALQLRKAYKLQTPRSQRPQNSAECVILNGRRAAAKIHQTTAQVDFVSLGSRRTRSREQTATNRQLTRMRSSVQ